jgi:hypothetical protein
MMQRGSNKAVTVLIPCEPREQQGLATFLQEFAEAQPVRVVTDADFKAGSKKRTEALSAMWDYEKEQFRAVLALLKALQSKDDLAIANAREHVRRAGEIRRAGDKKRGAVPARDSAFEQCLIPLFGLKPGHENEAIERWQGYRYGPRAERDERWLLSQLMSEALASVRLVLWWSGSQFRPALYCSETKAALYAFLLMKVSAGQGWGVCPKCGEFFVQERSDQNYCSIAHREAHRVARWRATKLTKEKGSGKAKDKKTR